MERLNNHFSSTLFLNYIKETDLIKFSEVSAQTIKTIGDTIGDYGCSGDIDFSNPFGLEHYSFFSECDISRDIVRKVEYNIEYNRLLLRCWTEEASVYWLNVLFNLETSPMRKNAIMSIMNDEHYHFMLFLNLLRLMYPETDLVSEYANVRNKFAVSGETVGLLDKFTPLEIIFNHLKGEVYIESEFKYQYKETTSKLYKLALKKIFTDEVHHVGYSSTFADLFSADDIKEEYKRKVFVAVKSLVRKGMHLFDLYNFKEEFLKHGININDYHSVIKKSLRSRRFVINTIEGLYLFSKNIGILGYDDFSRFLAEAQAEQYYKENA